MGQPLALGSELPLRTSGAYQLGEKDELSRVGMPGQSIAGQPAARDGSFVSSYPVKNVAEFFLSQLGPTGLARLHQCAQCEKWFVLTRSTKRFCSWECQQQFWADYRKTPKGRKYQRERVRAWRRGEKE